MEMSRAQAEMIHIGGAAKAATASQLTSGMVPKMLVASLVFVLVILSSSEGKAASFLRLPAAEGLMVFLGIGIFWEDRHNERKIRQNKHKEEIIRQRFHARLDALEGACLQ